MSYVRNWLHCVWGTKNKFSFLNAKNKLAIIKHIRENAKAKGIYMNSINGDKEHLHCLISLHADQSLAKVMQLIKGESSHWINKNKMYNSKFEWAVEYFAVSVSESQIEKVRNYIINQESHHKNKSWDDEYNEFMKFYKFEKLIG